MKKTDPRDRNYVRTAEDLRKRYDLSALSMHEKDGVITGEKLGETLKLGPDGKVNVVTVDKAIWQDKRPISSGGVYDIMGNVEEFLKSI